MRRIFNQANIRVAFRRGKTLRSQLVKLKDRLPKDRTTNCIYKIKCKDCPGVYIGQTARELHTRVQEHRRRLGRPPRSEPEYQAMIRDSVIAGHALDTGHSIDLDNVEIIRQGMKFTPHRLIGEAIEISKATNSLNKIEGVELPAVRSAVLNHYA